MLTLPPTKCHIVHNGAQIGKLEKEVLPPQWRAAGGRSSSAAATATSRSREATSGFGWVGAVGAGTKEDWAGAEGEIGGRPM